MADWADRTHVEQYIYFDDAKPNLISLGGAPTLAARSAGYTIPPPPDPGEGWADLYQTYDKWRQEDAHWYNTTIGAGDVVYPRKMAEARAQMAAGGMKYGSQQWNQVIGGIINERENIDTRYQEKKNVLENSSLATSLKVKYDELKNKKEVRAGSYQYEELYHRLKHADYKGYGPLYTVGLRTVKEYEELPTGKLVYGTGAGQDQTPGFDEFWGGQVGGATDVSNPYEPDAPIEETLEESNARQAASGRAF